MQRKPAEWDYILKTIKRDCADMLCMGLIPLAYILMFSLHKIHHVAQLKEIIQNGGEWSLSSEGENISLSDPAFFASLNLQTCPTFFFFFRWTPMPASIFVRV